MDDFSVANNSVIYFFILGGFFMYFVGIDIAKYKHDCCIINDKHRVVKVPFTFKNDLTGFNELLKVLNRFKSKGKIKIGFESTGHYATNLKVFLSQNKFTFMEFNSLLLHKFIETQSLRRLKTDKVDCEYIANYLTTVEYKPYPSRFYHIYSLKSLVRLYDSMVRNRSLYIVRLTNLLDHIFPEFKPFFNDRLGETALYILSKFPSLDKITNMPDDEFENIHNISRGRFSSNQFHKLKDLASRSVGNSNEFFEIELKSLIAIYHECDSQVNILKKNIEKAINKLKPRILTIPGIGAVTAATIYSEIGNFKSFSSANKIVAFAGLEPAFYQSGTSEQNGRMVKHGSSLLRYAIMNATLPLINFCPKFSKYYLKKRSEGKSHYVALSHLAKKLIRVMFTLETKGIDYNSKLLV